MNKEQNIILAVGLAVMLAVSTQVYGYQNATQEAIELLKKAEPLKDNDTVSVIEQPCVTYKDTNAVRLSMDEDCNQEQFLQAVNYYKANGYPIEGSYTDMLGEKSIELDTTEYYKSKIK